MHWGMFGEIPDQKVDVICSPSQTIRPPAGGQPRRRRPVHWGSRPHRYDREGTRRARVCPQQAGNTVVRASEGECQREPKRACPGNTFHALTCVIFVPSARFYMRSEATIRAVMVPVSRPKWASQGAKGPDIEQIGVSDRYNIYPRFDVPRIIILHHLRQILAPFGYFGPVLAIASSIALNHHQVHAKSRQALPQRFPGP